MRTFVDQPTQVFHSDTYTDTLATGAVLQVSASTLQDDLNSLRTQVKQLLHGNNSGNWYDAIALPSSSFGTASSIRGVNEVDLALFNVEQHRFLFRTQVMSNVPVATGSNVSTLVVASVQAPTVSAVVDTDAYGLGAVCASVPTIGTWSDHLVSGAALQTPKNLCLIRDAYTHMPLSTSVGGYEIYALLQVHAGTVSGQSFDDATHKGQLSFVRETALDSGSSQYTAVTVGDIGGRVVNYAYAQRIDFSDLPDDAYLSNDLYVELPMPVSGQYALEGDITLQNALFNQGSTPAYLNTNALVVINAGDQWSFLSGSQTLFGVSSGPNQVTSYVNSSFSGSSNSFNNGIQIGTGSIAQVNVGVVPGTVSSATGSNLTLSAGNQLSLGDSFGSVMLASGSAQYAQFVADFGASATIIGALDSIGSGSLRRNRKIAGVKSDLSANTNVSYPTNIDASMLDISSANFLNDLNIYLNGILLVPGANSSDPNDVYPGTVLTNGDLKFPMPLRSGSVLTMEMFNG